ncbi:DUF302 domain-containing protein [Sphingomicrobium sp. XHP0239]|uniref:DUF302 domain-containing protein n=1 Tax=Sphingomicrobium maritimum TaxID=3133972 RepID=UPI0031CCAC07
MRLAALPLILLALAGCDQQWSSDEAQAGRAETAHQDVQSTGGEVAAFGNGIQRVESEGTVVETVGRLETALTDNGFTVVARVDHEMNAGYADLELGPAVTLIFGKPEVGTHLMRAAPGAALDLPQKIAVYRDTDGKVMIAYNSPVWLASRHGIEGEDERVDTIARALENLATTAAGRADASPPVEDDVPGDAPLIMDDETSG